jgi:hypothetical protein
VQVLRATYVYDSRLEDITGVGDTNIVMQQGGFIFVTGQLHAIVLNTGPAFATLKGRLQLTTNDGEDIDSGADGCWLIRKSGWLEFGSSNNRKVPMVIDYIMSNPTITGGA